MHPTYYPHAISVRLVDVFGNNATATVKVKKLATNSSDEVLHLMEGT